MMPLLLPVFRKKWKDENWVASCPWQNLLFWSRGVQKKKTLKDNTKTPPSYTSPTHAVFLLSLHLVEFNSMSHLFHAVLSVLPSQSPPWCYFSPCLLSVFFSTPSSFLFGTWQFRCFFFLALLSSRPLCPKVREVAFCPFPLNQKYRGQNRFWSGKVQAFPWQRVGVPVLL